MKIRLILTSCLFVLCTSAAMAKDYHYTTVAGDLMNTRIYTLDNGLKIYLSVNKEKPRIQTYIAVRVGGKNDPAETTGLAHYFEHLMFKGTTHYGVTDPIKEAPLLDSITNRFEQYRHITDSVQRRAVYHKIDSLSQVASQYNIPNEYDKLMAAIGSTGSNAYTNYDVTCFTEDIPSNEIDNWAKIEADRFQNCVIRGFHTELEAVYEEKNISLTNDTNKEFDSLQSCLFPHHPYGTQTVLGTQEQLKNPSIVNIKNYYKQWYVPNNIAICMSGDFNPDEVVATIDKYCGDMKPNYDLPKLKYSAETDAAKPIFKTVYGPEADNVFLGWRFAGDGTYQSDTLSVISKMLYNGNAGLIDLDMNQQQAVLGAECQVVGFSDYSTMILLGLPKEGQTTSDVRNLLVKEVDKIKKGEFSDDLIPSVINNIKLDYYKSLENNESRADYFVNSFINGIKWEDMVSRISRISKITKREIIDFANSHFTDGYACIYKKQGDDPNEKKLDKPAITPIAANRDKSSQFLRDIQASQVKPIEPKFLDFNKDMSKTATKQGLPVLYKKNTDNGLFSLTYYYKFGTEDKKEMLTAADFLDYVGTDKMTAAQVKQAFYKLACKFSINVNSYSASITISGLNENMAKAVALSEYVMKHAKADQNVYDAYVANILKARSDEKLNQESNFDRLENYGTFGKYNNKTNIMSEQQLKNTKPQQLLDMIKLFNSYKHTVLYYGPYTQAQVVSLLDKEHKTPVKLQPVPQGKEYTQQTTPTTKIILAPYVAKNIYMMMIHNENKTWNPADAPVQAMFNEYFGKGMNGIVFQELREVRGLAYSAYAEYYHPSRKNFPEYYITYIISQNDKMMDCINEFNSILDNTPQSQSAFALAKESLKKRLASKRVTKTDEFDSYIRAEEMNLNYDINKKIYDAIPSLTLDDIIKFEKSNMAHKPYTYVILGDEKNLDMKSLEKIAPIQRVSTSEIFGY